MEEKPKKPRGLAAVSKERRQEIAAKGGAASHAKGTAHQWNSETARAASAARKNLKEKKK